MAVEFFQTIMGRKFYEFDVPRMAKALERIADTLEKIRTDGLSAAELAQEVADHDRAFVIKAKLGPPQEA